MSIILSMFGWFLPNHGKFLKTLIIIIVLGAIGFGIYYGLAQTNKKAASPVASKNTGPITTKLKSILVPSLIFPTILMTALATDRLDRYRYYRVR